MKLEKKNEQTTIEGEWITSCIHPTRPMEPRNRTQKDIQTIYNIIRKTETENKTNRINIFAPRDRNTIPINLHKKTQDPKDRNAEILTETIDLPTLIAILKAGWYHRLPKNRFDDEWTIDKLGAVALQILFGYSSYYKKVGNEEYNEDKYTHGEYKYWATVLETYTEEQIEEYAYQWKERFVGTYITLPMDCITPFHDI